MFSHYSDQHRGVCIEFKVTQDTFYQDMVQVEYGNYPTIKLADFPNRNASWLNAELASKFSGWGHEKEWRLLRMNGPKVYSFPEQLLTGVIFACNTSDEDKRLIMELAKKRQHPLKFYQAKKNNGDYSLDIVPE